MTDFNFALDRIFIESFERATDIRQALIVDYWDLKEYHMGRISAHRFFIDAPSEVHNSIYDALADAGINSYALWSNSQSINSHTGDTLSPHSSIGWRMI